LVVSHLFLPDSCGGAPIFSDLCYGLAGRGIDVTVRCAYPYYPEWKDKSGRNGVRIERSREGGLSIERYGLYIPRNPRALGQRFLYEASFFLSICRSLFRNEQFDAVLVFCPLAGSVAFASLYKRLHRRPLCLNVQDLPADAASAGGLVAAGWIKRLLRGVQKVLFNGADVWRSISPVMVERLELLRDRRQPVHLIPDWLHPTLAEEIGRLPSKLGRPPGRPVRLLYSGNIGTKQGLLDLCKALHASPDPFSFRIHGDGGSAAEVADWVSACGDRRFTFGPLVSEPEFVRALHDADLFVITEKAGSGASFFPSKTIPAMSAGTPILAVSSPDSPLGREMLGQRIGPWFAWEQCREIGGLLGSLEASPHEFHRWQHSAQQRSAFFDRERCLDLFQQVLDDLVEARVHVDAPALADRLLTPLADGALLNANPQ
jgi:colanic acid biosynthesis glycosyl transferase WcaI